MSLMDIIPVVQKTRMKRAPLGRAETKSRWQKRNRAHVNRYRRAWRAARRAA